MYGLCIHLRTDSMDPIMDPAIRSWIRSWMDYLYCTVIQCSLTTVSNLNCGEKAQLCACFVSCYI